MPEKIDDLFSDKNFGEESEVSAQTVDWGMVGDHIKGTFVRSRHNIPTQFGENSIYEFIADGGLFHKLTKKKAAEQPTIIKPGESWSVWGRNDILNSQLNGLRPGQVVKLLYFEEKETANGTSKIIKLYAPKNNDGTPIMNQKWLDANQTV